MKPTLLHHVVLGIALTSLSPRSSAAIHPKPLPAFSPGSRILFQGDSITDGNRGRSADPNHVLGHSYAFIIASGHHIMADEWLRAVRDAWPRR